MTLEQLAQFAQIIGTFVIVVTLIYMSIQVRQGTQMLRSEARQAIAATDQNEIYKFVDFPELGRLFSQTEQPGFEEKTRLLFWIIGAMRNREHAWLQYRAGASDEETWMSYRGVIYFLLGTERGLALWELCRPFFNSDFVNMVGEMMADAPPLLLWDKLEEVC